MTLGTLLSFTFCFACCTVCLKTPYDICTTDIRNPARNLKSLLKYAISVFEMSNHMYDIIYLYIFMGINDMPHYFNLTQLPPDKLNVQ